MHDAVMLSKLPAVLEDKPIPNLKSSWDYSSGKSTPQPVIFTQKEVEPLIQDPNFNIDVEAYLPSKSHYSPLSQEVSRTKVWAPKAHIPPRAKPKISTKPPEEYELVDMSSKKGNSLIDADEETVDMYVSNTTTTTTPEKEWNIPTPSAEKMEIIIQKEARKEKNLPHKEKFNKTKRSRTKIVEPCKKCNNLHEGVCKYKDYAESLRCSNCSKFGHSERKCQSQQKHVEGPADNRAPISDSENTVSGTGPAPPPGDAGVGVPPTQPPPQTVPPPKKKKAEFVPSINLLHKVSFREDFATSTYATIRIVSLVIVALLVLLSTVIVVDLVNHSIAATYGNLKDVSSALYLPMLLSYTFLSPWFYLVHIIFGVIVFAVHIACTKHLFEKLHTYEAITVERLSPVDARTDEAKRGDLKHEQPIERTYLCETFYLFCGCKIYKKCSVEIVVNVELLMQIATHANMMLNADDHITCARLESAAKTNTSVNMNRYRIQDGEHIRQNTVLLAVGIYKELRYTTRNLPFYRTPTTAT